MPRTARKKSSTGIYHIMMRGINRQQIFDDRTDCFAFLKIIKRLRENSALKSKNATPAWSLYAYALMGNHFHLLVNAGGMKLGELVKAIAGAYVFHYNQRHGRDGHLFRERFRSEPCDDDNYLITLVNYIHQNPVAAHLCKKAENYEFTSWHEYIGDASKDDCICDVNFILDKIPLQELKKLVDVPNDDNKCIEYENQHVKRVSDNVIRSYLLDKHSINHPGELLSLPKKKRNAIVLELKELGAGARQLQRLTGISASIISRIK